MGVVLTVSDEETHRKLLLKRGFMTGIKVAEEKELESFGRVRLSQREWAVVDWTGVDPDPLDVLADELSRVAR